MLRRDEQHSLSRSAVLATIIPAVAQILFFVPWGALAFLSFDRSDVPRPRVYAAVILVGVAFALALVAWQQVLPTRVTGWLDAAWNTIGCACGAALGHARKRVRIRFE
jgi:VanZ family protein